MVGILPSAHPVMQPQLRYGTCRQQPWIVGVLLQGCLSYIQAALRCSSEGNQATETGSRVRIHRVRVNHSLVDTECLAELPQALSGMRSHQARGAILR